MKANTVVSGPRSARIILLALIVVAAVVVSDSLVLPNAAGTARTSKAAAMLPPTDLFFSEYIEGLSNNKAIEIFNGTTLPINLLTSDYVLQICFNGNTSCTVNIHMDGIIMPGDVYVITHNAANATIQAQADVTSALVTFNGDDAVVLRKNGESGTIIDVIGQVGNDPGTEWGTGLTSTMDNTLVRKNSVFAGDTVPSDSFDPAVQWDGFATDTSSNLGSHSIAVTAADASINGRIVTADGRGIKNIRVVVLGGDLTEPRTALTSAFGYYRIDGLSAGGSYVVSVSGKRYLFEPASRFVSLGDDAFDINFVGEMR